MHGCVRRTFGAMGRSLSKGILKGLRNGRGAAVEAAPPHVASGDAERLLALMAEYEKSGSGWFWETDAKGNIAYLTGEIAELFGKSSEILPFTSFQSLFVTEQAGDGSTPRNL